MELVFYQQLFVNYYDAVGLLVAQVNVGDNLQSIVSPNKPAEDKNVALGGILKAMSTGISLIPGPEGSALATALV